MSTLFSLDFLPFLADGAEAAEAVTQIDRWQVFWAACTGAGFYLLTKIYGYLKDRSFNPKYNAAYITRFVCGIVGGFILAQIGGIFIDTGTQWAKVGPGILALVGGFASEVVEQALKRLVEMFQVLLKGGGEEDTKTKLEAQKTQLATAQSLKDAANRKLLTGIPTTSLPPQTAQAIQTVLANL